jgi:hypothetical protein
MQSLNIKSHRSGSTYQQPHFFILNKGNNSGKPLTAPCPNCFVIQFNNEDEKEQVYWLLFGLWRSKAFHSFLRGSVIPFVILRDVKDCIRAGYQKATETPEQFKKSVATLRSLEQMEAQYKQNLQLIAEAKQMVFYRYILKR